MHLFVKAGGRLYLSLSSVSTIDTLESLLPIDQDFRQSQLGDSARWTVTVFVLYNIITVQYDFFTVAGPWYHAMQFWVWIKFSSVSYCPRLFAVFLDLTFLYF